SGEGYSTVPSKMRGHMNDSPPDLRVLRPDAPVTLAALCRKLLAKQPAKRLQSAAELVDALSEWSGPAADSTQKSSAKPGGKKRVTTRRNPLIAIAIGIGVLGCFLFLILKQGFVPPAHQEPTPPTETANHKSLESNEKVNEELAPVAPKQDEPATPAS